MALTISWPRRVIEEIRSGLKNRHSDAPSTPAKEFITSLMAWDSGSFLARLASSRACHSVVTISGRQCFSREKRVPLGPLMSRSGLLACWPSANPTGSTRKVRMIEG
ncbi:hypothetical protein D3C71_1970050 [compost metagenome]